MNKKKMQLFLAEEVNVIQNWKADFCI
jgi:hypothetical protein